MAASSNSGIVIFFVALSFLVITITPTSVAFGDEFVVGLLPGSSVPGCEMNNSCFVPYEIKIDTSDTVTWVNDDTAAHTVTSGTQTGGPSGMFDSGLFMAGDTFSFTFDQVGTFEYICMVHPWMVGTVIVNQADDGSSAPPEPEPEPEPLPPFNVLQINVDTDRPSYESGDKIMILGNLVISGEPLLDIHVEIRVIGPDSNLVAFAPAILDQSDKFSYAILAGPPMQESGIYEVTAQYDTLKAFTTFSFTAVDVPPPPKPEPVEEQEHEPVPEPTTPVILSYGDVILTEGSGIPGCEMTNSCFVPDVIKIDTNDKVIWSNHDKAAHTVTSGTPADGPNGMFDSSGFLMAGDTFSFTFNKAGTFEYFCMVHPWMVGVVVVAQVDDGPLTPPEPEPEPKYLPPPSANVPQISIVTDRSSYESGDSIMILGNVGTLSESLHGSRVTIVIIGPTDNVAAIAQVTPNASGQFSHDILAGGSMQESGIYEVTAHYGTLEDFTTFSFTASVDVPQPPTSAPTPTPAPTPAPTPTSAPTPTPAPTQNDDLSGLIDENKKLKEELERQGEQIDELNEEVDLLKQIIQSIQGFFGSIFG